MAGPSPAVRRPAVAGLFYPADQDQCVRAATQYVQPNMDASGTKWIGGIVPHAGWICSGAIAGETIGTLAAASDAHGTGEPDVVIVFGAVHTPLPIDVAAMASHEAWQVPGGRSNVPMELSRRLHLDAPRLFAVDDRFHEREHAVEVELPLIQ